MIQFQGRPAPLDSVLFLSVCPSSTAQKKTYLIDSLFTFVISLGLYYFIDLNISSFLIMLFYWRAEKYKYLQLADRKRLDGFLLAPDWNYRNFALKLERFV